MVLCGFVPFEVFRRAWVYVGRQTLGSPLRPIAAAATEAARTDRCPCRFMPLPPFKALTAKSSHLSNTALYLSRCVAPHACGESRVYTSGLGKVQRFVNIR